MENKVVMLMLFCFSLPARASLVEKCLPAAPELGETSVCSDFSVCTESIHNVKGLDEAEAPSQLSRS